jgi:hypothetical protein
MAWLDSDQILIKQSSDRSPVTRPNFFGSPKLRNFDVRTIRLNLLLQAMQDPEELDCVLKHSNDPIICKFNLQSSTLSPPYERLTSTFHPLPCTLNINCDTNNTMLRRRETNSECHKSLVLEADVEFKRRTLLAVEAGNFILLVGVEPHLS